MTLETLFSRWRRAGHNLFLERSGIASSPHQEEVAVVVVVLEVIEAAIAGAAGWMIDVREHAGVEDPIPIPVDRAVPHPYRLVQAGLVQVDSSSERVVILARETGV